MRASDVGIITLNSSGMDDQESKGVEVKVEYLKLDVLTARKNLVGNLQGWRVCRLHFVPVSLITSHYQSLLVQV